MPLGASLPGGIRRRKRRGAQASVAACARLLMSLPMRLTVARSGDSASTGGRVSVRRCRAPRMRRCALCFFCPAIEKRIYYHER